MKNIILLIFVAVMAFKAHAQRKPKVSDWFQQRINDDVAKIYHTKSFKPHKDTWKEESYRLISLKESWKGTDMEGFEYVSLNERPIYKLIFKRGRIWDANGNEFDTRGINGAQFVMDRNGDIYASRKWIPEKFEHHSLVAGMPVVCAGKMVVYNGYLQTINDFSPQYPVKDHYPLTKVVSKLRSQGISFENVQVIYKKDFQ